MSFLMPKVSIPPPPQLEMPDDSKVPNLEDQARREQEAEDMRRRQRNRKGRRSEPKPIAQPIVEAKAEAKKYDDTKRKGRRSTILTSTSGVSEELELAKKTLLGG